MDYSDTEYVEVNCLLQRLSEEPVCGETKRELLVSYLRENALAALRSLPNEAFLNNTENIDEELELLASIKGLSEKESALYAQKPYKGKGCKGSRKRTEERVSLRMNGVKRMADLPSFLPPKNINQTPIQQVQSIAKAGTENSIQVEPTVTKVGAIESSELRQETKQKSKVVVKREETIPGKAVPRITDDNLLEMLSQISADSCHNELSSASSEFFPTPPTSSCVFY